MTVAQLNQLMTAIHGVTTKVHAAQRSTSMCVDAMGHTTVQQTPNIGFCPL
jgi:hypothetical protein